MSDKGFPFWSEDWARAQQQFWDSWASLARAGGGQPSPARDPWSEALQQWWQAVSPAAPDPVQEFYDHLVRQGRGFLQFTEQLRRMLTEAAGTAPAADDWRQAVDQAMEGMRKLFPGAREAGGNGASDDMVRQMLAFWELPMDTWQRTASVATGLPGDFLEAFKGGMPRASDAGVRDQLERFLSVPGLGYTREHQEQAQRMGRRWLAYQEALQEYAEQFGRIAQGSLERLREKLMGLAGAEKGPERLRDLYDLWVDACEEAYAEVVAGEEYAQAYGRLVNALMALKHQGQLLADESAGALGLPTRREVDCLEARMQEYRREVRALRGALEAEGRPAASAAPEPPAPPPSAPVRSGAAAPAKRAPAKKKRATPKAKQGDA